jgi:hypothetical protein
MNRLRMFALAVLSCIVLGGTATACGEAQPVYMQPTAWGENGHCYWVHSPDEVTAPGYGLIAQHRCQSGWSAMRAPDPWLMSHYDYYRSPAYVVYVPQSQRSSWPPRTLTVFGSTHHDQIVVAESRTKWTDASGKAIPQSTVQQQVKTGKTDFSGGGRDATFKAPAGGGSNSGNSGQQQKQQAAQNPSGKTDFSGGGRNNFSAPAPRAPAPAPAPARGR